MLTAEYGGTGGKPIESYLVVEEPDIEIGAGVSSKGMSQKSLYPNDRLIHQIAISRRMQTDKGGQQGPRSTREPPPSHGQRYRQSDRHENDSRNSNSNNADNNGNGNGNNSSNNTAPSVPGFGFNFPGMPTGFQFPPGFVFPGGMPNTQPPPPGAS